jgi:DNA invertase Pin-like site-specific DNA recombinase
MIQPSRCAIYARYSSEKQNALSIERQNRECTEYASKHNLTVLEEHFYSDEAISGATDDRAGLRKLLAATQEKPKPFDCILADDTSRLSRKLIDSLRIMETLKFAGVRVIFISQSIDSASEQAELLLGVHGLIDGIFLRELAQKTFRGCEQRVLDGFHSGGRVFGYSRVPVESKTQRDSFGRPIDESHSDRSQ